MPLLPHLGRGFRFCGNPAHPDVHELPLADLDGGADAGTGSRELSHWTDLGWTRANDLPDFAYFDHSIHINKGVGCNTCHGRVDKMPLMYNQASLQMECCLDCHRDPEKNLRPHYVKQDPKDPATMADQVFNMAYEEPSSLHPVTIREGDVYKTFTSQTGPDGLGTYLVRRTTCVRRATLPVAIPVIADRAERRGESCARGCELKQRI